MGIMLKAYKYCSDRQKQTERSGRDGRRGRTNLRQMSMAAELQTFFLEGLLTVAKEMNRLTC